MAIAVVDGYFMYSIHMNDNHIVGTVARLQTGQSVVVAQLHAQP